MNTLTYYKVVWIDAGGLLNEKDFTTQSQAENYISTYSLPDAHIYQYKIVGECNLIV